MEYVNFDQLPRMLKSEVMLYLKFMKQGGLFIDQTLANIETDWNYTPPFFTLMDNAYLTATELCNVIRANIAYLLRIKNNCNVDVNMIDSNIDLLMREAYVYSLNHGDDLYVCKYLTAYGNFVQAFIYTTPQIGDIDLKNVQAAINNGAEDEAVRKMLVDIIADYCLSGDYEFKFDRNIDNLSSELAFRIKTDAEKILMNLKMN